MRATGYFVHERGKRRMKLHELQEKRAAAVAEMRRIADQVEAENREYSAEEEKRHADLKKEIASLDAKIQRAKDVQEAERSAPAIISGNGKDGAFEDRAREFSITTAIRAAMGERVDDGRERELSAELQRRTGRSFSGIAVPDEVSIVGGTGLPSTALQNGGLTRIMQPMDQIGANAVRMLCYRYDNQCQLVPGLFLPAPIYLGSTTRSEENATMQRELSPGRE